MVKYILIDKVSMLVPSSTKTKPLGKDTFDTENIR